MLPLSKTLSFSGEAEMVGKARLEWTKVPRNFHDMPDIDTLGEYLEWFLEHGPSCPMTPADGLTFIGNGPGIVLHRDCQFQTQLFFAFPNSKIPEHRHPNVDSIEVNIAPCDLFFYVEGLPSIPHEALYEMRHGVSRWWGRGVRVRPNQFHHLEVGRTGGAFLSVQHWLNGKRPTSVDDDWEGQPMNFAHKEVLALRKIVEDCAQEASLEPI